MKKTMKNTAPLKPTGLLTELMEKPFGLSNPHPVFSWIVNDTDANEKQTAYRILVSDFQCDMDKNIGTVWDSGKIASDESTYVPYSGPALTMGKTYYWKVCTWDKHDAVSPFSDAVRFSMALDKWQAKAIWTDAPDFDKNTPYADDDTHHGNVIFARKNVVLQKSVSEIDSAVISITVAHPGFMPRGIEVTRQYGFKLYINGHFRGLGPHMCGYTPEDRFYNTFDVSDAFTDGTNTVGVLCYVLKEKKLMAELIITYKNGEKQTVITDESWKVLDGTAAYGEGRANIGKSYYYQAMAEDINAKLYPFGWNLPDFDDRDFVPATVKSPIQNLLPSTVDPVYEHEVIPASVFDKGNGNFLIDMGKEIIGGVKLTVDSDDLDGCTIEVLRGEELEEPNKVLWKMRTSNVYREIWTLKKGYQKIETFGMMGFRYVELTGLPASVTADMIQNGFRGNALYQKFDDDASYFVSNRKELNDLYDYCKYSLKVLTQDLYVDSQTRERGPYEGDAYINALSQYSFSRNYTVARFSNQFMAYHPQWCTEYAQMNAMNFYLDYLYTGNLNSVQKYYDIIRTKVFADFYDAKYHLINSGNLGKTPDNDTIRDLVDWPPTERDGYIVNSNEIQNPYNTVINSFNYAAAKDIAEMARLTNHMEDAEKMERLAENLKIGIAALYDEKDGRMHQGLDSDGKIIPGYPIQASVFPVALGVMDDPEKMEILAKSVAKDGFLCSVYGAQFLLMSLYMANCGKEGLDVMLSTGIRSYLHQIYELHATTVCEAWSTLLKTGMTFSHAWGSAPGNIIPRNLAGITPMEAGYKKACIRPQIGDLRFAKCKIPTMRGSVSVDVKNAENGCLEHLIVTIPCNMTAKVYVPANDDFHVLMDGENIDAVRDGKFLSVDNVGSGTHIFTIA